MNATSDSYSPEEFPTSDPLIAPFWADAYADTTDVNGTRGVVYYTNSSITNMSLLDRAANIVNTAFTEANFVPQQLYVVTWFEVDYFRRSDSSSSTFTGTNMVCKVLDRGDIDSRSSVMTYQSILSVIKATLKEIKSSALLIFHLMSFLVDKFIYTIHLTPQTNTFQTVLVANSVSSFVFFLYEEGGIQWTTGYADDGVNGMH